MLLTLIRKKNYDSKINKDLKKIALNLEGWTLN